MQQAWEDRQGKSLVHVCIFSSVIPRFLPLTIVILQLFCEFLNTHLKIGGQPSYHDLMTHLK
jgi:hypothetical protein